MGGGTALQLRVIDRGRARVVQVGERAADQPIRVGSAEDCDVRIPSAAPVHCELFIHRGQWVLRHTAGTAGGTWVNQKLVSKGAYLNTDDRIALGTSGDAVVIEVGPVAGVPAANAARPTAPDAIPELVAAGGATPSEETWLTEDEDEHVPFSVAASGEVIGTRSRGPRGSRRKSGGATGWTLLFTILVIAGAGAAVWKLRPTPPTPTPQPIAKQDVPAVKATNPVTLPVRETKNIFDNDWQKAPAKSVAATDPRKREESWLAIEKAMDGPSPGRALYLIEEYRTTRPGVLDAELKGLTKTALDRIWWERILALCDRRDELRAEIQRLGTDIAEESDAEFRKGLEADRTATEETLRGVLATLTGEMGYAGKEVPNPVDEEMLTHLRQHRDQKRYEDWGARVIQSAKTKRGTLPWEQVK